MTKERLIEMMDLVLSCKHWGTSHRVHLYVDNIGDHEVQVHPHVGAGGDMTVYLSNRSAADLMQQNDEYVFDPNFEKAEAKIRRLLKEIP